MRSVEVKGLDRPWSAITLGCWQIAPSYGWGDPCTPEEADRAVKAALEGGVTAFDTAEGYGDGESERRLGKALGEKKYDVLVISKIWPDADLTLPAYQERLEGTLRALNRDYIDVYLVHWPGEYFDSPEKSEKLCELMTALRDTGKAKTVGLSNFKTENLKLFGDHLSEFVVNQIPYNLLQREYEGDARNLCQQAGVGYMAFSPTARGLMAGRLDSKARQATTRQNYHLYQEPYLTHAKPALALLSEIAEEHKTAPVNIALAWVLAQDNITTAVVGSRKVDQIKEFCPAGGLQLTPDQLARLNQASQDFYDGLKD